MIRLFDKTKVFLSVISARRPTTMEPMTELIGDATWFVDSASLDEYGRELVKHDLASTVTEADGLVEARNAALDAAASVGADVCVELSDDLKKIEEPYYSDERKKYMARELGFPAAIRRMITGLSSTGASLAGVAPTSNPFYYRGKPVHPKAFIVGDLIMVRTKSPIRFDPQLRLKEDYDFTLAHLSTKVGRVARCDDVLATFLHRKNAGGAVAYRTPEAEQEAIAVLKRKWGARIKDNPKRPDEILLKLR